MRGTNKVEGSCEQQCAAEKKPAYPEHMTSHVVLGGLKSVTTRPAAVA